MVFLTSYSTCSIGFIRSSSLLWRLAAAATGDGRSYRYGEADADEGAGAGRVGQRDDDADRLALAVEQRTARAARVDRRVELDEPAQAAAVGTGGAAVEAGHHAGGRAAGQTELVADGDHRVADGQPGRGAEHG